MLAKTASSVADIPLPTLATPKLDGIRCITDKGRPLSRARKVLPNLYLQSLTAVLPDGLDGEIMLRDPCATFGDIQSAVSRIHGEPDFVFHVFDRQELPTRYIDRIWHVAELGLPIWCTPLMPVVCEDTHTLHAYYNECLALGYEGVMCRRSDSPYINGRSWELIKLKPTRDAEAVVIGFKEQRTNLNPQVPNNWGYASRPGGGTLKVPTGTLGGLLVRDALTGVEFGIGTGFDDELRARIWGAQATYLGRMVTYKYQEVGTDQRPRFPVFKGFRDVG